MKASRKYAVAMGFFFYGAILISMALAFSAGWQWGPSVTMIWFLALAWSSNECRKDAEKEEES